MVISTNSVNNRKSIEEWAPLRTLRVSYANQAKMYTALTENSAKFYEFKYAILLDDVEFSFRAIDEDYVILKLAYGISK